MSVISVSKLDLERIFAKEITSLWLKNIYNEKDTDIINTVLEELYFLIGKFQLDAEKIYNEVIDIMPDFTEYTRVVYENNKSLLTKRIKDIFEEIEVD